MNDENKFERFIREMPELGDAYHWKPHIIDVADTMFACKTWFQSYGVSFTGADVVAMTKLILKREEAARVREEALQKRGQKHDSG
jgi:hypothetical protein